jgi:hypothetical protein
MTPDQQARQAFETLIENVLAKLHATPEPDREGVLDRTRIALREIALKHGLAEPQAARWAGEIDRELRFRMLHGAQETSNDND